MKRIRLQFLVAFTLFLVLGIFNLQPIDAYAADIDYDITQYTINADIQSDGSIDVTEFLTYDFDSSANGIFRDIDYENPANVKYSATGIDQIKVYEAGIIDDSLDEYKNGTAKNGETGLYTIQKTESGVRLKIYCAAKNEVKRFVIQYHLPNAVIKYSDTADFYWRFIGSKWETDLNNVNIVVTIPEKSTALKIFSHGPLSGSNLIIDPNTVQYVINKLDAGDEVSLRVLFPSTLIQSNNKLVSRNELPSILAQEKKWSEEANLKRRTSMISIGLSITWLIISVIIYIVLYRKYGTRGKIYIDAVKEPPVNYGPAFAEYITKYNTIGPNGITAELMNLVRKKYIHIDESADEISLSKKNPDFTIKLNGLDTSCEYEHEAYLIDWFFNKIGNGKTVTLNEIKAYSTKHSSDFNKSFDELRKIMKKEAQQQNLVLEKTSAYKTALLFLLFSTGSGIILAYKNQMYEFMISAITLSLLLLLLSIFIKKPTYELALQKEEWLCYKKHLKMITSAKNTQNTSDYTLNYWEQALVFTIIFGNHKSAIKKLQTEFTDVDYLDPTLTYLHSGHGSTSVLDNLSNTVNSSITNFSSASGFSGGSSSGGSGGGGGGGGAF